MSRRLTSRSTDLLRLENAGYELDEVEGHLVINHIPYVTLERTVAYGKLVSRLELAGDRTIKPTDHVAYFIGAVPCDKLGQRMNKLVNNPCPQALTSALTADCSFSSKPPEGYSDYFEKMTRYIEIVANEAKAIDPNVTAQTCPVVVADEEDGSVFEYVDTASARAGIAPIAAKLGGASVAIIGLGGTGAYILDQVAKTPVERIVLFDGDQFVQHNAFRGPGAPSRDELAAAPAKVEYWASIYRKMHRGVEPHACYLDESNSTALLAGLDFVFIAMDRSHAKALIIGALETTGIPFIDCGLGLYEVDGRLGGVARITTSTPGHRDHVISRIPASDGDDDLYATNIQVADLNALNAVLAVIRWKKLAGFYNDLGGEHHSTYSLDVDGMTNEEILGDAAAEDAA